MPAASALLRKPELWAAQRVRADFGDSHIKGQASHKIISDGGCCPRAPPRLLTREQPAICSAT